MSAISDNKKYYKSRLPQLILNTALTFTGTYGLYVCSKIILPPKLMVAGHKQFLTNISLVVAIIQQLSTITAIFSNGNKQIVFISEELLLPIALVLETVVTSVYWPLKIFFVHLIFQKNPNYASKSRSEYLPLRVDLCLHLLPFLGMAANFFIFKKKKFLIDDSKIVLSLCASLGLLYIFWLKFLIPEGGKYPYPFLDIPEPWKTIVMLFVTNIAFGYFKLLQWLKSDSKEEKKLEKEE
ncbi:hypothetical protein HANVADRAFT_49497 [Hanseniaspora valbyensis NRRL Y-1626]|uniref:FAR-17a/AIG1-like protein n=1 Tax=Hanseniaspora valbyensis NRRL Y-1626 TaxID=766949 RepID=A0A1B7TBM0_9ASCO|nr:hypothetical protein HANVADRAFT_49497 [Hanseniaspora valbyensis NRRL Y-1626]